MALHFVSTSVLSSSNNGEYVEQLKENSDEVLRAQVAASKSAQKPLYEQLAEQAARKQAEYDANSKLIFAPPRAMNEDDIKYYEQLNEIQDKGRLNQRLQETNEIKAFKLAQQQNDSSSSIGSLIQPKQEDLKKKAVNITKIEVVRHKRKKDSTTNTSDKKTKIDSSDSSLGIDNESVPSLSLTSSTEHHPQEKEETSPPPPSTTTSPAAKNNLISLFGQYNSDEEDSS